MYVHTSRCIILPNLIATSIRKVSRVSLLNRNTARIGTNLSQSFSIIVDKTYIERLRATHLLIASFNNYQSRDKNSTLFFRDLRSALLFIFSAFQTLLSFARRRSSQGNDVTRCNFVVLPFETRWRAQVLKWYLAF